MDVGLYARVSTDKQEAENQLIILRGWCSKAGHKVVQEYVDITSGANDSRDAFDRLFVDAHKGALELVVFWDLSRFSRSGTLYTLQKLRELERAGVAWHSYQEPYFSTVGEFRDVVISIMATLAKIQRLKIVENTKAGMARARAQGVHTGRPLGSRDKKPRTRSCWKAPTKREPL